MSCRNLSTAVIFRISSAGVWQEESFDRVLRVSEKLDEKIAYVLDNPERNGFVNLPENYRWLWVAPKAEPSFARLGR
jgi:hypothetical protein